MQATIHSDKFDWTAAIHDEVVKSLCSSFGLDFLLFEDKVGGDVDTIHNVRQGIYATDLEKKRFEERGDYKSIITDAEGNAVLDKNGKVIKENKYHTNSAYISKGKKDNQIQQEGELYDKYRGTMMETGKHKRQLDHTIAASTIHNDAGRVLAELDGVTLANRDTNLNSTNWFVNNIKNAHSMEHFLNNIAPKKCDDLKGQIQKNSEKLSKLPENTPEQRHTKRELLSEISKDKEKLTALEMTLANKEEALKADVIARNAYEKEVNEAYYKGSKFLGNTLHASLNSGMKMGMRQVIGLVLAEVWFELKEQLPVIIDQCKTKFEMSDFLIKIKVTLENIWKRISARFQDLLVSFKDGFLGGLFASVTTTVVNIFFTTQKAIGKLIRECWQTIIQVTKLITFNPDNLAVGDLAKEVTRLIGLAVNVAIGTIVHQHLVNLISALPFGVYIASFLSALVAGILTVGFSYFLDYSEIMQKVWSYLNSLKSKYQSTLEFYQQINAELDEYLIELSKIEFNLDADELYIFSQSLASANSEYERGLVLAAEAQRRNIELPFEINNTKSGRDWLSGLSKK